MSSHPGFARAALAAPSGRVGGLTGNVFAALSYL